MTRVTFPHISCRALLIGATLLAILALPRSVSIAEDERREAPPTPEEVQVLDELVDWVGASFATAELRPNRRTSMTGAVLSRPRSFDLFRTYNGREDRSRLLESLPYGPEIRRAAYRYQVDGLLIAAVMEAESGFDPDAVSVDGARGLMQVMPDTARLFGYEEYWEPARNIDVGTRYLSWLLRQFDGDVALAVAAYNAGPGNVSRFDGVPPFGETRHYLERVLHRYVEYHQQLWRESGAQAWLQWDRSTPPDATLLPAATEAVALTQRS